MRQLITFFLVASAVAVCFGDPVPLAAPAADTPALSPEVKPEIKIIVEEASPSVDESVFEEDEEKAFTYPPDEETFPEETAPTSNSTSPSKPEESETDRPQESNPDDSLISINKNKKRPTKRPTTPRPSRTTRPPRPKTPVELILVLQWPITFSKEKGNRQVDTGKVKPGAGDATWTVHGLWPNNVRCNGKPLKNTDLTAGTKNDLAKAWPTYSFGQSDFSFWNYEWKKHGFCAGMTSPEAYFTTARDHWSKHHQVYDWLKAKSITPHDGNGYDTKKVIDAIESGGGLAKDQFALSCISKNGQKWLKEFKVCFDSSGKKLTKCPKNIANNTSGCGKTVHYFQNF